jgi:hypothetical protein
VLPPGLALKIAAAVKLPALDAFQGTLGQLAYNGGEYHPIRRA